MPVMENPVVWAAKSVGTYRRFLLSMSLYVIAAGLTAAAATSAVPTTLAGIGASASLSAIPLLVCMRFLLVRVQRLEREKRDGR